jgi:hypothetical protein
MSEKKTQGHCSVTHVVSNLRNIYRIGPEPACGISIGVAKKEVRDWTNRNNKKHWNP